MTWLVGVAARRSLPCAGCGLLARPNLRNRRLFDTTNSEDNVMAPPAMSGLSSPMPLTGARRCCS
jgi:hypothetical protein